jgi:hypothetical protein
LARSRESSGAQARQEWPLNLHGSRDDNITKPRKGPILAIAEARKGEAIMKPMMLAKTFGVVLALAATSLPAIIAGSGYALARGDGGGGGGGGGAAGGGGGGSERGDGASVLVPPGNPPSRVPPPRGFPKGKVVIRSNDGGNPNCVDYRRGMYSYYGYPIARLCQPYRPYVFEDD